MGRRIQNPANSTIALVVLIAGLALGLGRAASAFPADAAAKPRARVVPAARPGELAPAPAPSPAPPGELSPEVLKAANPPAPDPIPAPDAPAPGGEMPPADAKVAKAGAAANLPDPEALPPPAGGELPAPVPSKEGVDPAVEKAQAPAPTPLAGPAAAAGTPSINAQESEPGYVRPADKVPLGKQSIALSVDVVAPQFLNLNQAANLKIVVHNHGQHEAHGVVVRDQLPEGLAYVSSQPEAQRLDPLLSWNLGTLAAGSERVITVTVKPTKVGAFDHAATVTLNTGGKSRTLVREPKLKVEQTANTAKVLRGQPVQFKIVVSNPGDGPARNVTVQAKLSSGLRHESGEPNDQNLFEQTIDQIGPGERVELDTLVADTLLGGEQTCTVAAQSPDVVGNAQSTQAVTVVEPKLALKILGAKERYTDTVADYSITLENGGTAPAKNVRTIATLPVSAALVALPAGARWDKQTRRLTWVRTQLDPGDKATLSFQVRMGGIGLYQFAAEARADTVALAKDVVSTDVSGLADVEINVVEKRRVVDVDGTTVFEVKLVNSGTKEATQLLLSADLSENLEAIDTSGTEQGAKANPANHKIVFEPIPRLGPGKSMDIGIRVKALKPGIGTCRVYLLHADLAEKIDDVAAFKVTNAQR